MRYPLQKVTQVGACSVEHTDDFIIVHWVGLPSLSELQNVYSVLGESLQETGIQRVLFDLTRADATPPGADLRRYASQWWQRNVDKAMLASFGMTWVVRVVMELVARTVHLFGHSFVSKNFATEAEARAWLLQQTLSPAPRR